MRTFLPFEHGHWAALLLKYYLGICLYVRNFNEYIMSEFEVNITQNQYVKLKNQIFFMSFEINGTIPICTNVSLICSDFYYLCIRYIYVNI